jgi:hypothetical protein
MNKAWYLAYERLFSVAVVPELSVVITQEVVNELLMSDDAGLHEALKKCFHSLMTCPEETVRTQLETLLRRLESIGMRNVAIILFCVAVM